MTTSVGIGLLGMGTVGAAPAQTLLARSDQLAGIIGCGMSLERVLVRDAEIDRPFNPPKGLLTTTAHDVLDNPKISIVVAVIGGQQPALDFIRRDIFLGKHVVTANKAVMARYGSEIQQLASEAGVQVLFEAIKGLEDLDAGHHVGNLVRVEEWQQTHAQHLVRCRGPRDPR